MKLYLIILSFSVILCASTFAQKGDAQTGYIVDNEGDRVEGFILSQTDKINYVVKVRFSEKENTKKYPQHKPKSVSAYGFEEVRKNNMGEDYIHWRNFIRYEFERPARILASNSSFIEKVAEGELDLYQFLYETGADVDHPITTRYVVMQDGEELIQIEAEDFKKSANQIFKGYDALIKSLGKPKFEFYNLPRLVDDYNYWLENKHDSNTYKMNPVIFTQ